MKRRVLVFTTGMGHLSLAQAIGEAFDKKGWEVKLSYHRFAEELVYKPFYLFFPSLFKPWFEWGKKSWVRKSIPFFVRWKKRKTVERELEEFPPHLVVSTYFLYNEVLAQLKERFGFVFFNLLANPWTFHPLELSPRADLNLVYDRLAKKKAIQWGIEPEKLAVIGWPVREVFYQVKNYPQKDFSLLICGGSEGTVTVARFLPVLLTFTFPLKLILVAGRNVPLYRSFLFFKKGVEGKIWSAKGRVKVDVYRFHQRMDQLMEEVDLVAGKAGPNLIFESVAAGRPFLALSWIHGHEEGNLRIIKEKRLGWVAKEKEEVKKIIEKWVKKKDRKIIEGVKKERRRLKKTAQKITSLATNFLSPKSPA